MKSIRGGRGSASPGSSQSRPVKSPILDAAFVALHDGSQPGALRGHNWGAIWIIFPINTVKALTYERKAVVPTATIYSLFV